MATGRVSRVSRAGQVPWYSGYVMSPPPLVFTDLWTKVGQHMALMGELVAGEW